MDRPRITVIVTVRNAFEPLRDCLESVLGSEAGLPHRLLLLDDASDDPRVLTLLHETAGSHPHVELLRNERHLGYTESVNRALGRSAPDDVVLLNSDTVVTRGWLRKLAEAAASPQNVATVTPLSNAAGAFSVPRNQFANPIPPHLGIEGMARLVERLSPRLRPLVPTGNGFCMYVRRRALDLVGGLDAARFPAGYGSENDFCMRASEAGFVHRIDDATLVAHRRGATFGPRRRELSEAARHLLRRIHPRYPRLVRQWLRHDPLDPFRRRLQGALDRSAPAPAGLRPRPGDRRPALLQILHDGGGGTRVAAEDLARGVARRYRSLLLEMGVRGWRLGEATPGGGIRPLESYRFRRPWGIDLVPGEERVRALREACAVHDVRLAHVRHLLAGAPEMLGLLRAMGIPVVLSLHDYYLVCPTIQLVDDTGRFCGGDCDRNEGARGIERPARGLARLLPRPLRRLGPPRPAGDCRVAPGWFRGAPRLRHQYVHLWRRRVQAALPSCNAFVTTSRAARDILCSHLEPLRERGVRIVEHGRDLAGFRDVASPPARPPLRGVCFGAFHGNPAKGLPLLEEILRDDAARGDGLEIHVLGVQARPGRLARLGAVEHGAYRLEDLPDLLEGIAPSFSILPSIWPETFCHTLTESWAAGLPVFASDLGALGERIRAHGGGWLLDPRAPEGWCEAIVRHAGDPEDYGARRREIAAMRPRGIREMAQAYLELYEEVLGGVPVEG